MALIKCPECGKSISDKVSKCPNCGLPQEFFSDAHKAPAQMDIDYGFRSAITVNEMVLQVTVRDICYP